MTILATTKDARALVVGANQGIGLGFVRQLLTRENISQVFATYRQPEAAQDLLKLAHEHGQRLHCLSLDLTQEDQIQAVCAQIQSHVGHLHGVINCVGLLHDDQISPEKSLRHLNAEQLLRYFQVNSVGPVLLAKHLLPLLNHIQPNIFASISAKIGSIGDNRLGGWYGYRASKAALNMFLKTASIEYSRRSSNTIIVMLHPGTTDTRLSKPFQRNVPPEKLFSVDRTVQQLLSVLDNVTPADHGEFFSWDGSRLPW